MHKTLINQNISKSQHRQVKEILKNQRRNKKDVYIQ